MFPCLYQSCWCRDFSVKCASLIFFSRPWLHFSFWTSVVLFQPFAVLKILYFNHIFTYLCSTFLSSTSVLPLLISHVFPIFFSSFYQCRTLGFCFILLFSFSYFHDVFMYLILFKNLVVAAYVAASLVVVVNDFVAFVLLCCC